jgi:hypothetical protein
MQSAERAASSLRMLEHADGAVRQQAELIAAVYVSTHGGVMERKIDSQLPLATRLH